MKRFGIIILALLAASFISCEKDDATGLEGEWIVYRDDYHPLTITFKGSEYDYYVQGISPRRDKGTFSYDGQYLTLSPSEYWEIDYETDKLARINASDANFSMHKFQVLAFDGSVLVAKSLVNDFYAEGLVTYWTRGEDKQTLDSKDLKGTWVAEGDYGSKYIFIFDGTSYTLYSMGNYNVREGDEWTLVVGSVKETGTWKHSKGVLSLNPTKVQCSMDENTYYHVNVETGESETWVDASYSPDPYECDLHLSGNTVYVRMDIMEALAFTKK